jgi:hypothetical protein
MKAKGMTRHQARQALKEIPISEVLLVSNSELTAKQKEFARQVALGETGASAYRKAYDTKAKKKTQGDNASRLKADSRIQAEIEAYQLANQAAAYRTAEGLRSLVIHSLTQVLIDPETKQAQKIQAAKVLGTVTEVAAFTERKIVSHTQDSADIKEKILEQLKTLMIGTGAGNEVQDVDAIELLNELTTTSDDDSEIVMGTVSDSGMDATHSTPTPLESNEPHPDHEHTIPPEAPPSETTPMHFESNTPEGDIKIENGDVNKIASGTKSR